MAFSAFKAGAVHEVPILANSLKLISLTSSKVKPFQQLKTFPIRSAINLLDFQKYCNNSTVPAHLPVRQGRQENDFHHQHQHQHWDSNQSHEELVDMANN